MATVKFSKDHEWIRAEGSAGVVGISDFAQEQLGDLVFVELPDIGKKLAKGDEAAVIESVKAAGEVYAPVGGEVTEVNEALGDDPTKINTDSLGDGWIFKMSIDDEGELDGLMDEAAYEKFVEELD
ncbi:MAG: glycine cleavage system protein GcvH [Rhodospirillales bacterium]|jgi:glycine cleavage system H protein|nr:glycine cleavage system protein GcvH [Rhodospirillales bacterium]HJO72680.1 glycine cleavage system protein GcvH [Rhodospirillales bacterium]